MLKRWISLLLVLGLLLSLCACTGNEPSETEGTTEPTTASEVETTTESTAPPAPTGFELFAQAKEALLSAANLSLTAETKQSRTVGVNSYERKESINALYQNLQGELLAKVDGVLSFRSGAESAEHTYTERYAQGVTYATFNEAKHREEIASEDYLARQIPLCLFDAENFTASDCSENGSAMTLTFTEPKALESWVAPEYAELLTAEATAKIENDHFKEMTYTATFRQGSADLSVSYRITLNILAEASLSAEAPEDAESYALLSHVVAPRLMEEAVFNLSVCNNKSSTYTQIITSQAAGYAAQVTNNIAEYGSGADYMTKIEANITEMTQEGQKTMKTEELFANGKYTYKVDGELADEGSVGADVFSDAIYSMIMDYIPVGDWITEATVYDLGDGYLVEFSSEDEEGRGYYKQMTTEEIFGENTVLDDNASAYEHKVLSGYLGIDKDTLLATSYSVDFQGSHTIQGAPYVLSQQVYGGFTYAGVKAHKEITDKLPTEEEPETKASPVFYHVTGQNGEEMWLLGTIHLGDERTGFLPQEVYSAFDAADALAVEFDSNAASDAMEEDPEFAQKIAALMMYTDGSTILDHVDAEVYEKAVQYMKYYGQYYTGVELLKASMWMQTLTNAMISGHRSLTTEKGVDQRLLDRAQAAGKEILNVESMESQMQMLSDFSHELQEYLLQSSLEETRSDYVAGVEELYELWCSGDETALRERLNEKEEVEDPTEAALAEEYWSALSTNRDKGMVETAKDYLNSGKTVFYAVGLAHLLAENGLVDSLRAAGYTVELVSYAG